MCENLEELYLLEFYVDAVKYRDIYDGRASLPTKPLNIGPNDLGETIVKFKYFGSNHVEIREEDFCPSTKPIRENSRKVALKSGKSCLFSLKSLQHLPSGSFDVVASVFRKILNPEAFQNRNNNDDDDDDENWEDVSDDVKVGDEDIADKGKMEPKTEFLIGKTDVSLYETFKYLKNDFPSKESLVRENSSTYNGFQDCIDRSYKNGTAVVECHSYLRDEENSVMGEIVYLVRASCFGRTILTQFQLSEEEAKSYMYKRTDRNVCARDGKGDRDLGGDRDFRGDRDLGGVDNPKGGVIHEGVKRGEVGEEKKSFEKEEGKKGGSREVEQQSKSSKPPKKNKKPLDCPFGFDESGEMDLKAICECVCKCVMSSVQNNNNQQGQNVRPDNRGSDYDKVSPGSVGMVGNQMILRMPDKPDKLGVESKFTSSVYYTQNGEDVGENIGQIVNVRPEYPHMTTKDDPDSKQDVLVLKLGRKRIAAGKKPRIEIEMRTPKFKDEKPVSESKETQYLASDIPKTPKKGKGKKGDKPGSAKSGKSGKGGKKKK